MLRKEKALPLSLSPKAPRVLSALGVSSNDHLYIGREHFCPTQWKPFPHERSLPTHLALPLGASDLIPVPVESPNLGGSWQWNHTSYGLLYMVSVTQHHDLEVYPCSMYQCLVPFYA